VQNEDGAWGDDVVSQVQETVLSLMALTKGSYKGETEQKAVDWLLRQQGGNNKWGSNITGGEKKILQRFKGYSGLQWKDLLLYQFFSLVEKQLLIPFNLL